MSSQEADLDLARRLAARDGSALAELYDRFGRVVYSLAYRVLKIAGEAEEVTQEVFLYAWEKSSMYDGKRGSLVTWLATMARSRSIDRLRQQKSQDRRKEALSRDSNLFPFEVRSPEWEASLSEVREVVREALARLPAEQRQAIEVAYFEGLSQSEIAIRLNIPLGTIKTRIRQGMIRMREALKPLMSEDQA